LKDKGCVKNNSEENKKIALKTKRRKTMSISALKRQNSSTNR
jgi:hypothetical protein